MPTSISCVTPSRVAISLLDMNGSLGRVDGGTGFALNKPELKFTMGKADRITLESGNLFSDELRTSVQTNLDRLAKRYQFGGVKVVVNAAIPEHSGFGSKTATLLSLTKMFGLLNSTDIPFSELALFVGRGGTSGIGVHILDKGGFILDGGHSTTNKPNFAPSSASAPTSLPPLLARLPMPQHEILIVNPPLKKIFGEAEKKFFRELCPIPDRDVEKISRIVLMQLLPAVAEDDLNSMAAAINSIQELTWKRSEIDIHGNMVKEIMAYGRANGALMAGMSSIGPGIYFIGGELQRVRDKLVSKYQFAEGQEIFFSSANNRGLIYKVGA